MAKVLVSFDDATLDRIDRTARARGLTRSGYLTSLAEEDARRRSLERDRVVRAALITIDALAASAPAGDSTVDIRTARDAR